MKCILRFILAFYFIFPLRSLSQADTAAYVPPAPSWDTTKYIKYKDRLVIGVFTSWRQFDYTFDQKYTQADSGKAVQHYLADANSVTGIEIDYDKLSVSVGFKTSPSNTALKGNTTYKNFSISVGGNKWILETSYRKYKGFYDQNTAAYDTSYKSGDPYYQNPSMRVEQLKAKFMFFTNNKKFAYKAGYGFTCRQLRSAFTWVLGGNVYSNKMRTDTSFFSPQVRPWYGTDDSLVQLGVTGLSFGGGASFNLVLWKSLFMNLTFCLYAEPQWRNYTRLGAPVSRLCYLSGSGDARFSIGYNAKNFFVSLNSFNDFVAVNSKNLLISSKFISGSFNFGYRFKVKAPGFYRKFQRTRLYKML